MASQCGEIGMNFGRLGRSSPVGCAPEYSANRGDSGASYGRLVSLRLWRGAATRFSESASNISPG